MRRSFFFAKNKEASTRENALSHLLGFSSLDSTATLRQTSQDRNNIYIKAVVTSKKEQESS
jgi:hypothetical protein